MSKRDTAAFKIEKAADMIVTALPPIERHPGEFIRDTLLPEYGLKVAEAARELKIDRAGFHGVLTGKYDVSRDLAYKLGALMRDEVADLLIAYQHAFDLARERDKREAYKATITRRELPPSKPSIPATGSPVEHGERKKVSREEVQAVYGETPPARSKRAINLDEDAA